MNFVNGAIESLRNRFSNLWSREEEPNESVGISRGQVEQPVGQVEQPVGQVEQQPIKQFQQEQPRTNAVEGFIVSTNHQQNRSLVLIQSNEHTWQTKWFNDAETTYTTPSTSFQAIFK